MLTDLLSPARIFAAGQHVPVPVGNLLATVGGTLAGLYPIPALRQWEANVEQVVSRTPTSAERRALARNWARNNLWSMSLGRWTNAQVIRRARINDEHVAALHRSLQGPGLILALPHMGSWDFAGTWCACAGIRVASVAERLPRGLFERFSTSRQLMGMKIHALDEPDLLRLLVDDILEGQMVCLLADRDFGGRGVPVTWPSGAVTMMPPGPALLARRTGADLRVATTCFRGGIVEMRVSEPVPTGEGVTQATQHLCDAFGTAIAEDPANWLVLQRLTPLSA